MEQVNVTTIYDSRYVKLAYPGGDLPIERGVCADVIVRAYRRLNVDLQVLVHDDMAANWSKYPHLWQERRPDFNIDHRRVPNLQTFFRRHGRVLPVSADPADYRSGDIVTWRLPSGAAHIGLLTDKREGHHFLVVHNVGRGARIEDVLFEYVVTGHYRIFLEGS